MEHNTAPGALEGIRVLDLGILVQGPQAALLLGDLGADVIKIELPGLGDQARWIPVSMDDRRPPFFIGCNRGKRGITLDLRRPEGRQIFLRLSDTADVVISNFTPGTMDAWGLGYEVLASRNPRVIYGAGSSFGSVGPDASRQGADLAGQAAGGLIFRTGSGIQDAGPVGVTIADHIGSQNLANGILAALVARARTGRGQKVEVSLLGGQIFAQASEYTYYFLTGKVPGHADHGHPLVPMLYGTFPTADGQIAIVGVMTDHRQSFFQAIGRPELYDDARFQAQMIVGEARRELFEALAQTFRSKPTADWETVLRAANQRYAPVRDYDAVANDEGAFLNGYLQRVDHPEWGETVAVGTPIQMSDTPAKPGQIAPELGQHTEEVLLDLGYSWEEIGSFRESGVI